MPTYRYRCEGCGEDFERWQSITDDALTTHDGDAGCGGHVVKVLSPAGIVLKGSGFYKTDNRGKRSSSKNGDGTKEKESSKPSDGSSSSSSDSSSGSSGSKDSSGSGSSSSGSGASSPGSSGSSSGSKSTSSTGSS